MKKYKEKFIWWIVSWLWILLTIWLWGVVYWAYVSMTNVTSWTPLTASSYNQLIDNVTALKNTVDWLSNIPVGFIWSFNLSTCPSGWIAADGTNSTPDLRWQFLRWINTFDWWTTTRADWNQDPDGALRVVWNYQADEFKSHTHTFPRIWDFSWSSNWIYFNNAWSAWLYHAIETWIHYAWWNETRSKNVWVIFCIKQ